MYTNSSPQSNPGNGSFQQGQHQRSAYYRDIPAPPNPALQPPSPQVPPVQPEVSPEAINDETSSNSLATQGNGQGTGDAQSDAAVDRTSMATEERASRNQDEAQYRKLEKMLKNGHSVDFALKKIGLTDPVKALAFLTRFHDENNRRQPGQAVITVKSKPRAVFDAWELADDFWIVLEPPDANGKGTYAINKTASTG